MPARTYTVDSFIKGMESITTASIFLGRTIVWTGSAPWLYPPFLTVVKDGRWAPVEKSALRVTDRGERRDAGTGGGSKGPSLNKRVARKDS